MAKTKVSEWSAIPANNTDVGGIDINEGCAPSGINNAIRDIMSQIKDMQTGADGDNFAVGGNLSVSGTITSSGNLTGNLVGNVTGNLTGNVTGNVTGTSANVTGVVDVANGGTGVSTLTGVVIGNGSSDMTAVAPSTSGNVLTSNGTNWTSSAPAPSIGVGQTWQNVTGSRAANVTYTNSTNAPIQVLISVSNNVAVSIALVIDGAIRQQNTINATSSIACVSAIIPVNSTYSISIAGTLSNWSELR